MASVRERYSEAWMRLMYMCPSKSDGSGGGGAGRTPEYRGDRRLGGASGTAVGSGDEVAVLGPVEDVPAAAVPTLAARELETAPHVRIARDDQGHVGKIDLGYQQRHGRAVRLTREPKAGELPDADVAVVPGGVEGGLRPAYFLSLYYY